MANSAALHEALRTEVVDRHGLSGLNLVLVRLQRSKTDITFSLHAEPTLFNLSGRFMSAHLLERIGFSVGDCAFVERGKCLARGVPEGFDVRGFATVIATATETLREGCDALLECGFFAEHKLFSTGGMGNLPQQMLSHPHGDGHNASTTKQMKESEDESFRFVFTWIDSGDGRKGWTTHYIPKHLPLSAEVSSVMEFIELRTFVECPEAGFEPCHWRFLHCIPGYDYGFNGPAEIAHEWFGAHETKFSKGIAKLLEAEAVVNSFGFGVLPSVQTNVPPEAIQPPRQARGVRRRGARAPEVGRPTRSSSTRLRGSPTVPAETIGPFDVAVSFAGTERELAESLAVRVRDAGYEVFYDRFFPEQLWGKDLAVFFDDAFRKKSRFCVIFVSKQYVERDWTNHERRSAVSRLIESKGQEYILPIKVEDVELPGIQATIGYLSLKDYDIETIANLLIAKLGA